MINKIFRYTKLFISLYFIYFFTDYTVKNQEKLISIFNKSASILILIVFFKIIIVYLNSIIFREIVWLFKIKISLSTANELTIINYLGNLLGPFKLGAGMRIEYLRQNHKINIKNFILKNFNFTIYTQLIYISIFLLALYLDKKINFLVFMIILTFVLSNLIIFNRTKVFGKLNLFSIKDFLGNALFNTSIITLFLIGVTVVALEINLVLNYSYEFIKGIYVFEAISLTNIANLTPANLGIREFALLSINSLHELSLNDLIEIGIIDRFCSLFSIFILFLIENLKKLLKNLIQNNNEV